MRFLGKITLLLGLAALGGTIAARDADAPARQAGAISDARMLNAANEPNNWLVPGGGRFDGQFYSTLNQINTETVKRLAPGWYFEFDTDRGQEAEPIVVDGVMYVSTAWSKVYALDARTGKQLWFYDPEVPGRFGVRACCDVVNRGVAVYEGKVFVGTIDGRLVALDAATGKPVWSTLTVDQSKMYTVTGAPRVIKGKVIIGNAGADFGVRGYVSAYDTGTGKLVWRFYTTPGDPAKGPDNAASDNIMASLVQPTWHGEWYKYGSGGTAWNAIAYDPELDQLYIGTGNGSPWNYRIRSDSKGDNLFLCSVVALDPDTGKYIWHYQENPAESWDYNSVQPMVQATLTIDGKPRKVLMHAPKNGFFYVIDRTNGKLISAKPYVGGITWASSIDLATGRPIETPGVRFEKGPFTLSPGLSGAHGIQPMAFNPNTGLIYFQVSENALVIRDVEEFHAEQDGPSNSGVHTAGVSVKRYFIAYDPVAQREVWRKDVAGGGALTTAGGLVFQARGSVVGELAAYRATDGKELWSYPMPNYAMPAPVTYEIDGVQYIAIVSGAGGPTALISGSATAYARQPGRVVVFRLSGTAKLPADPDRAPPPNPAKEQWPAAAVASGEKLFGRYCARCHGAGAASANVVPDLRRSTALSERETWKAIVHDGALEANGMIGWSKFLDEAQIEDIRGFVSSKAQVLKASGDPAPSRNKRAIPDASAAEAQ